jgi:hypothetical protein
MGSVRHDNHIAMGCSSRASPPAAIRRPMPQGLGGKWKARVLRYAWSQEGRGEVPPSMPFQRPITAHSVRSVDLYRNPVRAASSAVRRERSRGRTRWPRPPRAQIAACSPACSPCGEAKTGRSARRMPQVVRFGVATRCTSAFWTLLSVAGGTRGNLDPDVVRPILHVDLDAFVRRRLRDPLLVGKPVR